MKKRCPGRPLPRALGSGSWLSGSPGIAKRWLGAFGGERLFLMPRRRSSGATGFRQCARCTLVVIGVHQWVQADSERVALPRTSLGLQSCCEWVGSPLYGSSTGGLGSVVPVQAVRKRSSTSCSAPDLPKTGAPRTAAVHSRACRIGQRQLGVSQREFGRGRPPTAIAAFLPPTARGRPTAQDRVGSIALPDRCGLLTRL